MEKETVINNIKIYNTRMDASIEDKLWFLRQNIDADIYVDFGCANGNLLRHIYYKDPSKIYIGYDNNSDMLSIARDYCKNTRIIFIYNFENIKKYIDQKYSGKKICLILSSVLHEVYSYSKDKDDIKNFWNMIKKNLNPDYIAIRDMMHGFDPNVCLKKYQLRELLNISDEQCAKVRHRANQKQVIDFEKIYGPITCYRNLTHFLLKYKYVENWDREVRENYFPYEPVDIRKELSQFKVAYEKEYCLPYLYELFKKDFGIDYLGYTHYNFLFQKL